MKPYLLAAALAAFAPSAIAEPVAFDGSWREQGFLRLFSNDYSQGGGTLGVVSDGTVSLLWKVLPERLHRATRASWGWSVAEGVPVTDLRQKGGDDRNLSIYFVWTDPQTVAEANMNRAASLLRRDTTKVLAYVWGDDAARGTILPSPYLPGLRTVVLRPAGTGQHTEQVDLAGDYARAFGDAPGLLVGIGISADSDDTDTVIRASVSAPDLR
ncbi:MAG: DUF3047 domain-containing protein [Pseudomonadota bacterium]